MAQRIGRVAIRRLFAVMGGFRPAPVLPEAERPAEEILGNYAAGGSHLLVTTDALYRLEGDALGERIAWDDVTSYSLPTSKAEANEVVIQTMHGEREIRVPGRYVSEGRTFTDAWMLVKLLHCYCRSSSRPLPPTT